MYQLLVMIWKLLHHLKHPSTQALPYWEDIWLLQVRQDFVILIPDGFQNDMLALKYLVILPDCANLNFDFGGVPSRVSATKSYQTHCSFVIHWLRASTPFVKKSSKHLYPPIGQPQPAIGVLGNIAGKQRNAYNPSLHRGQVHPESTSNLVISDKSGQWIRSEAITLFSNHVHIWKGLR